MSTDDLDNSFLLRAERLEQLDRTPVKVTWQDAYQGYAHWHHVADIPNEPRIIQTVGWLIWGKVDDHVSVGQSRDGDHFDAVLHVPIRMVKTVERLRVKR